MRTAGPLAAADVLSLAAGVFAVAAGMALLTLGGFSPTDDGAALLLLPPVLAASPLFVRGTPVARAVRVAGAVVFAGLWFVAAASVGWFFAPAALLAAAAAAAVGGRNGV